MLIVIAGVSCAGKTTTGLALSSSLSSETVFIDADDYHSTAAKAQMGSGVGLTDAQRDEWFARLEAAVRAAAQGPPGRHVILACSALTLRLRSRLRHLCSKDLFVPLLIVWLHLSMDTAAARLASRPNHWATHPDFLRDQFRVAETPRGNETTAEGDVIVVVADEGDFVSTVASEVERRVAVEREVGRRR